MKYLALILMTIFSPLLIAGEWFVDPGTGCKIWMQAAANPEIKVEWSGVCVDGYAHGPGILQLYKDGKSTGKYTGDFEQGKRTGNGTLEFANGNIYTGKFNDSKRTGNGVFKWADGEIYEGDFIDGVREGKGVYKWKNGNSYEGDFKDGKMTGSAVYKWANGNMHRGEFDDGKIQGFGVRTLIDGYQIQAPSGDVRGTIYAMWDNGKITKQFFDCNSKESCLEKEKSRIAACVNANVPNPNPHPNETTRFYGSCSNSKANNGVVIWYQNGKPYDFSCMKRGEYINSINGSFVECKKEFFSMVPEFCEKENFFGQCRDGKPHGFGVERIRNNAGKPDWFVYSGNFENGEYHGFGKKEYSGFYFSGVVVDHTERGYYQNGKLIASCQKNQGPAECEKSFGAMPIFQKARQAQDNLRCDQALELDRKGQQQDGRKHSSEDFSNGFEINYSFCKSNAEFESVKKSKDPQAMYLSAGKFERNGESHRAKTIYSLIIERFPSSPFAVKANDQLSLASRSEQFEMNRRNEQYNASTQCRERKSKCKSSCGSGSDSYKCWNRCESICSE